MGNPVWPIPVPPQPVLEIIGDDVEKGPARVGAFVPASLGMAFAGIVAAIPELASDVLQFTNLRSTGLNMRTKPSLFQRNLPHTRKSSSSSGKAQFLWLAKEPRIT